MMSPSWSSTGESIRCPARKVPLRLARSSSTTLLPRTEIRACRRETEPWSTWTLGVGIPAENVLSLRKERILRLPRGRGERGRGSRPLGRFALIEDIPGEGVAESVHRPQQRRFSGAVAERGAQPRPRRWSGSTPRRRWQAREHPGFPPSRSPGAPARAATREAQRPSERGEPGGPPERVAGSQSRKRSFRSAFAMCGRENDGKILGNP